MFLVLWIFILSDQLKRERTKKRQDRWKEGRKEGKKERRKVIRNEGMAFRVPGKFTFRV